MSDVPSLLLADARATLLRRVVSVAGKGDTEEAFANWLVGHAHSSLSIDAAVTEATNASGAARSSCSVATLGYAAGIRQLTNEEERALKSGLSWIVDCDPVVRARRCRFAWMP